MIYDAAHIFFLIIFIYLGINILYLLIAAVAGKFRKTTSRNNHTSKKKIAVLITSYREDEVIVNTVSSASGHDYPPHLFDVYLAADQLAPETIDQLKKLRVKILPVSFVTGTKARSLNSLLNFIDEDEYDIALILDADNIMMPGFMEKINIAFQRGFKAVQGHRTAKNINTPVAILDAVSEETNNHLFRKGQRALGFSASLIGSGMAFELKKLKEIYNKPGILSNPACDREVDFEMMKAGIEVEYLEDALVLDEKVSTKNIYENQRRRWIESQLMHLRLFFSHDEKINRKNIHYWNKLFINLIPPRMIVLAIFFVIFAIVFLQYFIRINITGIPASAWLFLFIAYVLVIFLSLPPRFMNAATAKAFIHLPLILFSFLKAALTIRMNRKEFIHTPKSFTEKTGTGNQ
jgi:cellulose synthase/poly-beta-1,6-N-acetylglucosamine synthase-like glycosyltransferase